MHGSVLDVYVMLRHDGFQQDGRAWTFYISRSQTLSLPLEQKLSFPISYQ